MLFVDGTYTIYAICTKLIDMHAKQKPLLGGIVSCAWTGSRTHTTSRFEYTHNKLCAVHGNTRENPLVRFFCSAFRCSQQHTTRTHRPFPSCCMVGANTRVWIAPHLHHIHRASSSIKLMLWLTISSGSECEGCWATMVDFHISCMWYCK